MMGGWLARLKNLKSPVPPATKPTKPPHGDEKAGFVGFVAYPWEGSKKIEVADAVALGESGPAYAAATKPAQPQACSSCRHLSNRGTCLEPVAAGLRT
jgi:hypothetical protein